MSKPNREIYKNIYSLTEREKRMLYGSTDEDNKKIKEQKRHSKSLQEYKEYLRENDIILSTVIIKSIPDLIAKYSNSSHIVRYNNIAHTLHIKGSMRVDIFHLLIIEAARFRFNNIILES